jgi:hypothetical protein
MRQEFERVTDDRVRRGLKTLLHPELLGRTFQFLALSRGVSRDASLSGMASHSLRLDSVSPYRNGSPFGDNPNVFPI